MVGGNVWPRIRQKTSENKRVGQKSAHSLISLLRVRLFFKGGFHNEDYTPENEHREPNMIGLGICISFQTWRFGYLHPWSYNIAPGKRPILGRPISGAMFNFQGVCQLSGEWPAIIQLLPWNFTPSNSSSSSALSFARECSWTPLVSTSSPRKWTAEALRQGNIGSFLQELLGTYGWKSMGGFTKDTSTVGSLIFGSTDLRVTKGRRLSYLRHYTLLRSLTNL